MRLVTKVALLVATLAACSRGSQSSEGPRAAATDAGTPAAESASSAFAAAADASIDGGSAGADSLAAARSIGNTSVVFKLTFSSGAKAAYKPRSKRGRDRYKGEVAAYRLAQALAVPNVPEASFRAFSVAELEGALTTHAPSLDIARKEIVADASGNVAGAYIPWIANLEVLGLEADPWRTKWRTWLMSADPIPKEDVPLAAQIATMIVFDGITGNWDRWSGANVGWSAKSRELLFIDNDGAFMVPTPVPFDRQRELVAGLKKYPRGLVEKLRAMDAPAFARVIGEETAGVPLLSDAALREADSRRRTLLAEVDARVRELGQARVFVFE